MRGRARAGERACERACVCARAGGRAVRIHSAGLPDSSGAPPAPGVGTSGRLHRLSLCYPIIDFCASSHCSHTWKLPQDPCFFKIKKAHPRLPTATEGDSHRTARQAGPAAGCRGRRLPPCLPRKRYFCLLYSSTTTRPLSSLRLFKSESH